MKCNRHVSSFTQTHLDGREWVTRESGPLLWHVMRRHPEAEFRRRKKKKKRQLSGMKNRTLIRGSSCVRSLKGHPDVSFPGWDVCVNPLRGRYQKSNTSFWFATKCIFQGGLFLFKCDAFCLDYQLFLWFISNLNSISRVQVSLGNLFPQVEWTWTCLCWAERSCRHNTDIWSSPFSADAVTMELLLQLN